MKTIVCVERASLGPGVSLRAPRFAHRWEDHERVPAGEVAARLSEADIAVVNKLPIGEEVLARAPRLRMIAVSATGTDNVDVAACRRRGIVVSNVRGYATTTVPEHTFALILALRRGIASYAQSVQRGDWQKSGQFCYFDFPISDLRGSRLGIVGGGAIGAAVAAIGRAFGMDVVFHDPYQPSGFELATGLKRARTLEDLLRVADVVSVHTPLSPETTGLLGAKAFAAAKPGLVVVNTARGPIVDLDALHDALKSGKVAAAGLDVLPKEPADANHPLIRAFLDREEWLEGRFTLSPHAAFYSPDANDDLRRKTIETVLDHIETGSLSNCVNLHQLRRG